MFGTRNAVFALATLCVAFAVAGPGTGAATQMPAGADPDAPPPGPIHPPTRTVKFDDLKLDPTQFITRIAPIDTSIVLNLGKMEREPERRWSLHLSFGATQTSLERSVKRARLMERFGRDAFGDLQAGGFQLGWSDAGPTEPKNGFRVQGDLRYKLNPLLTLEGQVGSANAITAFAQPGFRFDEKAEILDISGGALFTLPWRLWRFGFYAGGGGGFLRGKLTSAFYVPSFSGVPFYLVSNATGTSSQYHFRGGGEMYITRFVSFTVEGEYRNAEIEKLKYTDSAPYPERAKARDEYEGVGGVGNVPHVWNYYVFSLQEQQFFWFAQDPDRPDLPIEPININFTGVSVVAGLRYHF